MHDDQRLDWEQIGTSRHMAFFRCKGLSYFRFSIKDLMRIGEYTHTRSSVPWRGPTPAPSITAGICCLAAPALPSQYYLQRSHQAEQNGRIRSTRNSSAMALFLGLDVSTSAAKAIVIDAESIVVARGVSRFKPLPASVNGRAEQQVRSLHSKQCTVR